MIIFYDLRILITIYKSINTLNNKYILNTIHSHLFADCEIFVNYNWIRILLILFKHKQQQHKISMK